MTDQAEIIRTMACAADISHKKAEQALAAYFGAVAGELGAGARVRLPGIGSLVAKPTEEHQARNPRTGAKITVKAGHKVKFRTAAALKAILAAAQYG